MTEKSAFSVLNLKLRRRVRLLPDAQVALITCKLTDQVPLTRTERWLWRWIRPDFEPVPKQKFSIQRARQLHAASENMTEDWIRFLERSPNSTPDNSVQDLKITSGSPVDNHVENTDSQS